jgi:NAD(P)-dependent dehydrogenase (short-subunit alcohol dehydrogenase family)
MSGLVEGKVALVTGGASGIGRAAALAFAREGALVAVADRTEAAAQATVAMINATGGQAIAIAADVTHAEDVAAMVARTLIAFGRLDCAFNNAGIAPFQVGSLGQKLHETGEASWDAVLAVNLTGVFLCMKHQVPAMLRQGGGSIVNTASIAGLVGLPTSSAYVASKHAVIGITKTAALEYALDRIRVNAVCPGYIRTPMTDASVERRGEELMSKIPVRRIGEPDDIAEAVVWMSSDRAGYITGSAYAVDGGYSAM